MKKVLVAMSGGIDSSVTAALLQQYGYKVGAITMRLLKSYSNNDPSVDAAIVADKLGIEHHIIDIADFFENTVVNYFIYDYMKGFTPNPCIYCNRVVKFGLLFDQTEKLGYDCFATGHYAQIFNGYLARGEDVLKDQSYFLYPIYKRNVSKIIFPLGAMTKKEVRNYAEKYGLHNAHKKDSQDICFIQGGNYQDFFAGRVKSNTDIGYIINTSGQIIGTHSGIHNYTIGQRKGLGALGRPMFVKQILPQSNAIVAAMDDELMSSSFKIIDTIFCDIPINSDKEYLVQVRYRSKPVKCFIEPVSDSVMNINLSEPLRAIAAGQSAVIYDGEKVLGGGIIDS